MQPLVSPLIESLEKNAMIKYVNDDYFNKDSVANVLHYLEDHPIDNGTNGLGCSVRSEEAGNDFYLVKHIFHQTESHQLKHIIISFDEHSVFLTNELYKIAWDIAYYFFMQHFQVYYAIHASADSTYKIRYHIHFAVNTVSFLNGRRLPSSYQAKEEFIQYIQSLPYQIHLTPVNRYF